MCPGAERVAKHMRKVKSDCDTHGKGGNNVGRTVYGVKRCGL